jgi:hypothetical protein
VQNNTVEFLKIFADGRQDAILFLYKNWETNPGSIFHGVTAGQMETVWNLCEWREHP